MPKTPDATFGELLRQHRLAAQLTQEALAERAGLSVHGIQKLERGATHPYRDTAQRLMLALGLAADDEARLQAAVQPVRRYRPASALTNGNTPPHNLPGAISSFIGRDQELLEVAARLAGARLLTLTGTGGCGKTRLAVEVARSVQQRYPDGVWFVELGPLAEPAQVTHRIGAVLGIDETAGQPLTSALVDALVSRCLVLVLDNCEHLLQACAVLVDALLRACPELQILATSREPIGVDGEIVWRVPSLPVPDPHAAQSLADLERTPAVQLFMERATAAQPRFALTVRNAPAVAEICRRLDGLPLALEMAAARVDALTAEQLAVRLDKRFRLLTGGRRAAVPRQQTLSATLDWSYSLLGPAERRLFERLAVFAGHWTLEAAEAVCAGDRLGPDVVVDVLLGLIRKSLVVADDAVEGSARYRLLESVREYALEKLVARGRAATAAARMRHASYYSHLVERAQLDVSPGSAWPTLDAMSAPVVDRLDGAHDNLRAALRWWIDADRQAEGLSLAVTLVTFWGARGVHAGGAEFLSWLKEALDGPAQPPNTGDGGTSAVPPRLRAHALRSVGVLVGRRGDYAESRTFLEPCVALWRALDDRAELAHALSNLGLVVWLTGDSEQARDLLDESTRLSRATGDGVRLASTLCVLGMIACSQTDYELALSLCRESLATLRTLPGTSNAYGIARSLSQLGRVVYLQGDYPRADLLLREALEPMRASRLAGEALADCLDWLAAIAGTRQQPERAARLFGAASAQWRSAGWVRWAPDQPAYERDLAMVRAQLQEQPFAAAFAQGREMSAEHAIAYALD
jgi:non-specific serine/threonine protein kinase